MYFNFQLNLYVDSIIIINMYFIYIGAKQLKISFLLENISDDILRFFCNVYGEEKVKSIQPKDAYNLLKSSSVKVNLFIC